jgi:glycerol-3-phosphate dehydrogenase
VASASNAAQESDRLSSLRQKASTRVMVIGGGINGIATFRDLALQGVDVTLVERSDFCSGATAASSHMIHGGVRYLENGELRLVKESLMERNRLLASAPHYVRPLKTTIPIFSLVSGLLAAPIRLFTHAQGKPKERGALLIKVGLMMYDLFGRNQGKMPRHSFLGRQKSWLKCPT